MFLGESGHFHFWVNVTTFTFAFFHFCFLSFGPFVILNCSSCQKNATDEGAIALKALDFQINVKNCISYFNIGGQKRKSVEYQSFDCLVWFESTHGSSETRSKRSFCSFARVLS